MVYTLAEAYGSFRPSPCSTLWTAFLFSGGANKTMSSIHKCFCAKILSMFGLTTASSNDIMAQRKDWLQQTELLLLTMT